MADPENEEFDEQKEVVQENPLKVSRRLIYLHRLVGDDVLTPKMKTSRPNPWRVTLVFIFYASCSTISIVSYIDVTSMAQTNLAIEKALRHTPWGFSGGRHTYHADINRVEDVPKYIQNSIIPQMWLKGNFSEGKAIDTYCQVTGGDLGYCPKAATFWLSMRKVKITVDPDATTKRFNQLYPETWKGETIKHGSNFSDDEETEDLWARYIYDIEDLVKIPESHLGYDKKDGNSSDKLTFETLIVKPVHDVWVKWAYSPACEPIKCGDNNGIDGKGGYVATIVVIDNPAQTAKLNNMALTGEVQWETLAEFASETFVYLLADRRSDAGDVITSKEHGSCGTGAGQVRATNVMKLKDFIEAGFIDTATTTVSLSFYAYNSNKQTAAAVRTHFDVQSVGVVNTPGRIHIQTIRLDLEDTYYLHWEMFYIFGTVFYFIELFVYKGIKFRSKLFRDIWTYVNAISIICSCLSIGMRFHYSSLNADTITKPSVEFGDFTRLLGAARSYMTFSSIALLTIWLRVVELLAETPPRVKLLEATLIKAMGNMVIYFCYIGVILVGFFAFACVHFCAYSSDFLDVFSTFISVFEMLCINVQPYASTGQASLRRYFFIPYMMFAIISVQMFNSIINYAYNRVSEDMEPVFRKAAREKKHKDRLQKSTFTIVLRVLKTSCAWLQNKIRSKKVVANDGMSLHVGKKAKDPDIVTAEDLAPADKERLDAFGDANEKKQASESGFAFMLYAIFAVSYFMFLWLALQVPSNGGIAHAVGDAVLGSKIPTHESSGHISYSQLREIRNLHQLSWWITTALPDIVFAGTSGKNTGFYGNKTQCLQNWNCFYTGTNFSSAPKIVRITQRLQRRIDNVGLVDMDPPTPLKKTRFDSGRMMIPKRGPNKPLAPDGDNEGKEDKTTDIVLSYNGDVFCRRDNKGGYLDKGGIVCLLDADKYNMTRQLHVMATGNFFSVKTATVVVDMVLYNGNSNSIVYVSLAFVLLPSGSIEVDDKIFAFSLLDVEEGEPDMGSGDYLLNLWANITKLSFLFGIIYAVLVFKFIYGLALELQAEIRTEAANGKNCAVATWEFFALDIFHTLDLISYVVSLISLVLFTIWLSQQLQLTEKKNGNFSEFLTYISGLSNNSRLYGVLSSANMLCVFVRPLKYLRNDPRMAKINLTFAHAFEDIAWFTIMLIFFFTGFCLFAYVSFGPRLEEYQYIQNSAVACFTILIGQFDFWTLWAVNPWAAFLFVFSFLFLFKFFFLNVFFAIMDKNFVQGEPPPINLKRSLKPMFSRLVRWVEWDEDYTITGIDKEHKEGPPSRAGKVHNLAMQIAEIRDSDQMGSADGETVVKKSKALSDVCEVDEKMNEVLRWSRDEARTFVENYRKLQVQKQEFRNDDVFLKNKVKVAIDKELAANRDAMMEAERHQRYAILVNEAMERRDQETLSKYILRLEDKITKKMIEKHALLTDVYHLRAESEKMRYSDDDMRRIVDEETVVVREDSAPQAAVVEHEGQQSGPGEEQEPADSDEEYAQPEVPLAKTGQGNGTNGHVLMLE